MNEKELRHVDNLAHHTGWWHGRYRRDGIPQLSLEEKEITIPPPIEEYIVYQGPPGHVQRYITKKKLC